MKKILMFVGLNLLIGNTVAWFMGAAPIDFAPVKYSNQEQALISQLNSAIADGQDSTDQMQLGSIYSLHNQLDEAEQLLQQAYQQQATPITQAWLNATKAKQAGAMFDPLMGLVKLYRLRHACEQITAAVTADPQSFEVRMIRLATFAPTNFANCSLEYAFEDEQWFLNFFAQYGDTIPDEVKMQFYVTASKAHANADDKQKSAQYLEQFKLLAAQKPLSPLLQYELNQAEQLLGDS